MFFVLPIFFVVAAITYVIYIKICFNEMPFNIM